MNESIHQVLMQEGLQADVKVSLPIRDFERVQLQSYQY